MMKNLWKRSLAFILPLMMLVSLIPGTGYAADAPLDPDSGITPLTQGVDLESDTGAIDQESNINENDTGENDLDGAETDKDVDAGGNEGTNVNNDEETGISGLEDEGEGEGIVVGDGDEEGRETYKPTAVRFFEPDGDVPDYSKEVTYNSELNAKEDYLFTEYDWNFLDLPALAGTTNSLGDYSQLYGKPAYEKALVTLVQDPMDRTSIFGRIYVDENGIIWMEINEDAGEKFPDGLEDYKAGFKQKMDCDDTIIDEGGRVNFEVPLTKKVLSFIDSRSEPVEPAITKDNSTFNKDATINWTVKYQAPSANYKGDEPVVIEDVLPEYTAFVSGSLKFDGQSMDDPAINDGKFTIDVSSIKDSKEHTISYTTKATDEAILAIIGALKEPEIKEFKNVASILDAEGGTIGSDEGVAPVGDWKKDSAVVTKNGTSNVAEGERTIDWTVTVDTHGVTFGYLTVVDTMGKALKIDSHDSFNIQVNNIPLDESEYTYNAETNEFKLNLVGKGSKIPKANTYVITYTTTIIDDYFDLDSGLTKNDAKNQATLEWGWDPGTGVEGLIPPDPTIKVAAGLETTFENTLKKSCTAYDSASHKITWALNINGNKINLKTFTLTENINYDKSGTANKYMQKLVKIGDSTISSASDVKTALETVLGEGVTVSDVTLTKSDKLKEYINGKTAEGETEDVYGVEYSTYFDTFSAKVSGLGTEHISSLPLTTQIVDPEFNQNNISSKQKFWNSATMTGITAILDDGSEKTFKKTLDVEANTERTNAIFSKEVNSYKIVTDAETGEKENVLQWKIDLNKIKTSLHNVVITDTIPKGLKYKAAALHGASAATGAIDSDCISVEDKDDGTQLVTISLTNEKYKDVITEKNAYILLDTVVELNESFIESDSMTYTNKVSMDSKEYDNVTASGSATINNTQIDKKNIKTEGSVMTFQVEINPNGTDIGKSYDKVKIKDKVAEGAVVDTDSIKLYNAKVTMSKDKTTYTPVLTKTTLVEDAEFTYDVKDNSFEITLPDNDKTYILEYAVYVLKAGTELSNTATAIGTKLKPDEQDTDTEEFEISSYSGGKVPSKNYSIQIKKLDTNNKAITISGDKNAQFVLRDVNGNDISAEQTINDEGYTIFSIPKKAIPAGVDTFYIVETKAPEGFPELEDPEHGDVVKVVSLADLKVGQLETFKVYNGYTSVTATKKWDDNNDQDGKRNKFKLALYADGVKVQGSEQTLDPSDGPCTWNDLPKYKLVKGVGQVEIEYSVKETLVPDQYKSSTESGPAKAVDGKVTITNTYKPVEVEITANKKWDDKNNQDGYRKSFTFTLYADGKKVSRDDADVTFSDVDAAKDTPSYTWKNLPKFRDHGTKIVYSVKETVVPANYKSSTDGGNVDASWDETGLKGSATVTNTHTPDTTSIKATKTWADADDQDGIRYEYGITLFANGQPASEEVKLNKNKLEHTWNDLPVFENGKKITYAVKETTVPEGYTSDAADPKPAVNGEVGITNTHEPEMIELQVEKKWADENDYDGLRAGYGVTLYADGKAVGNEVMLTLQQTSYKWPKQPKYRDHGVEIKYTIKETTIPNLYTSDADTPVEVGADGKLTVTNTHIVEKVTVSGTKTWDDFDDNDGLRPEKIKVNLMAKAEGETSAEKVDEATVSAAEDGSWTYSFTGLDKYKKGKLISYSVTEEAIDYYETNYADIEVSEDGNQVTADIENRQIYTLVEAEKIWDDDDIKDAPGYAEVGRPEVTILLTGKVGPTTVSSEEQSTNAKKNWKVKFDKLPMYNAEGELITYTLSEISVDGYTVVVDTEKNTVTNTPIEGEKITPVDLTIIKTNADGTKKLAGAYFTVKMGDEVLGTTEATDENGETSFTFTSKGIYTIIETTAPKGYNESTEEYTVEVEQSGIINVTKNEDNVFIKLYNLFFASEVPYSEGELTITDTKIKTEVTAEKFWEDNNDEFKHRAEYGLTLYADGQPYGEEVMLDPDTLSYKWTDLDKYNDEGEIIEYTVVETTVPDFYESSTEAEAAEVVEGKAQIVNTYSPTQVRVDKKWMYETDYEKTRGAFGVTLYANGKAYGKEVKLGPNDKSYTWTDLPKTVGGVEMVYTVVETTVPEGYTSSAPSVDEAAEVVEGVALIENTFDDHPINLFATVEVAKVWNDEEFIDAEGYERPESVVILLTGTVDGMTVYEASSEATADTDWAVSFISVPKFFDGQLIKYSITEETGMMGNYVVTETKGIDLVSEDLQQYEGEITNTPVESDDEGYNPVEITLTKTDDRTGEGLEGARFTVSLDGEIVGTTQKTDEFGEVSFEFSKPGTYEVTETTAPSGYVLNEKVFKVVVKKSKKVERIEETETGRIYYYDLYFEENEPYSAGVLIVTDKSDVTEVTVKKVWDDKNNVDKMRDDYGVTLYANGKKASEEIIMSSSETTYTWDNLPKYENSKLIKYTVKETTVPEGYKASTAKNAAKTVDGIATITNTHTPKHPGPKTGDHFKLQLILMLMTLCVMAGAGAIVYRRRRG